MNERDNDIIVYLAASVAAYTAILYSTKTKRQKKGTYNGIVSDLRLADREDF